MPLQVVHADSDAAIPPQFETHVENDQDGTEVESVKAATEDTSDPDSSTETDPFADSSSDNVDEETQPEILENDITQDAKSAHSSAASAGTEPPVDSSSSDVDSETQPEIPENDVTQDAQAGNSGENSAQVANEEDVESEDQGVDSSPNPSDEIIESDQETQTGADDSGLSSLGTVKDTEGESEDVKSETSIEPVSHSTEQCVQPNSSDDEDQLDGGNGECASIGETEVLESVSSLGEQVEVEEQEPTQTESVEAVAVDVAPSIPDPYFYVSGVKHSYLPNGGDCSGKTNCTVSSTPIQDALKFAKTQLLDDNTIYFESGTYSENFTIDGFTSELIMRPEDSATASFSGAISILNNAVPITIRDFTILDGSTITINNSDDVIIVGTSNDDYFDLYVTGTDDVNVDVGGADGSDELTINGTSGADTIKFQSNFTLNSNQTIEYEAVEDLVVEGGGGSDTFIGPDVETSFDIIGTNSGTMTTVDESIAFSSIENLTGASKADTFILQTGGNLSGAVDGGTHIDTLDYSNRTSGATVNLSTGSAPSITGGVSNIENVTGTSAADNLTGDGIDNVFVGNGGADALVGNDGDDTLIVTLSGSSALAISVDGGNDTDTLTIEGTSGADSFVVDIVNSQVTRGGNQTVTYSNFDGDNEKVTVDG